MEQSVLEQLKNHLAKLTKEQFAAEWQEIKDLQLGGPTVDAFECSWESIHNEMLVEVFAPPKPNEIMSDITIPKKLTPNYRGLSFFSNLVS